MNTPMPTKEDLALFLRGAANNNVAQVMEYLDRFGTEYIDQQDGSGWSALMYAAKNNSIDTLKLLLEYGASPKTKSNLGSTALMLAETVENNKAVQILRAWFPADHPHKQTPAYIERKERARQKLGEKYEDRIKQLRQQRMQTRFKP